MFGGFQKVGAPLGVYNKDHSMLVCIRAACSWTLPSVHHTAISFSNSSTEEFGFWLKLFLLLQAARHPKFVAEAYPARERGQMEPVSSLSHR